MVKILDVFSKVWSILVFLFIIWCIFGVFLSADNIVSGWNKVTQIMSPFNIVNYIVIIILYLPSIGATKLKDYLIKKRKED